MTLGAGSASPWTRVGIPLGAGLFLCALAGSALAVPELRPLHVFQALIYVAVVLLARRDHASGFGAGATIAVVWNSLQLFVTHLMQAGAGELWILLRTGHLHRPDTLAVFVGGVGHFILLVACLEAFRRLQPDGKQWRRFVMGGAISPAYFGVTVAILMPR